MHQGSEDQAAAYADLVLWSDESLVAVNKPAGVLAIPGGYSTLPHLQGILEPLFGRLWVVHRLDKDTSGALVLARTAQVHRALNTQFQEHTVLKVYHALVSGQPGWSERTLDLPLQPNGDRRHRTLVLAGKHASGLGKPAVTAFRVLERFGQFALVEAIPTTGRTHQIRAHLAFLGLSIVADTLYGGGSHLLLSSIKPSYRSGTAHPGALPERPLLVRPGLHALRLTLTHPATQKAVCLEAPYPKDLAATLRQLRRHGTSAAT